MPSIVQSFALAMHAQAAPMIGEETMTVSSVSFSVVAADESTSLEFVDARNERTKSLRVVLRSDAITSAIAENALATIRGQDWRIKEIANKNATFATITLETETRA